jgi:hypothetical protein
MIAIYHQEIFNESHLIILLHEKKQSNAHVYPIIDI